MNDIEPSGLLPRLYERDIDVLLQEELLFNSSVRRLVAEALKLPQVMDVQDCQLSVVDHSGETDVMVTFSVGSRRCALLIENKIDASFQPRQPERYRERVATLVSPGGPFDAAFSMLIAPKDYSRDGDPNVASFDAAVSYEDIASAVEADGAPRSYHRARLLRRAIEQARSMYILVEAPAVTSLWDRIFQIANTEYPILDMKRPGGKGSNSNWVVFKGTLPPKVTIDWKIKKATVDLSFWPGALIIPPSSVDLTALANVALSNPVLRDLGATRVITMRVCSPPANFVEMNDGLIREALNTAMALHGFYEDLEEQIRPTART
ncbi:hypothetical protein [Mesorhizobium sp. M0586]|uniref:hypothetical protein n=1 Tax=unclassified Mesorhizobium TaxID=325217 RepID=UPI00333BE56D